MLVAFTFHIQQELFHRVCCKEAADWLQREENSQNIERGRNFNNSVVLLEELVVRELFESFELLAVFGEHLCQLVKQRKYVKSFLNATVK